MKKRVSFFTNDKDKPGWKLSLEPTMLANGCTNMQKIVKLMYVLGEIKELKDVDENLIKKAYIKHLNYIGKENPAEYMQSLMTAKHKQYDIASGLTKDSWLHIMRHNQFQVIEWDILITKRNVN